MVVGRDAPSILLGTQEDYRRLYYSEPDAALKVPISIQAGYGQCYMGQAMAKNSSAAGNMNKMVPYDPDTIDGTQENHPRAYLVQNSGTTATVLYVTLTDSYRFSVGDDVYIADNTTTAENLGAITVIDRTTYTHMAAITVTTATGGTSFTTARYAFIAVEGYATAVGILEKSVDTGTGSDAKGAVATLILGNCVLYSGRLTNVDSAARTDLSASTFGNFTYIR